MAGNPGFVKDVITPDRIPLAALARELDLDVSTLYRWILRGVRGRNGARVRLQAFKLAGRTFVRRDDLESFIESINQITPTSSVEGAQTQHKRADGRRTLARAELERAGVKTS